MNYLLIARSKRSPQQGMLLTAFVAIAASALLLASIASPASADTPIELNIRPGSPAAPQVTQPAWNSAYPWQQISGYNTWTPFKSTALPAGYELRSGYQGRPGLWLWPTGSSAAGGKAYTPGYAEFAFAAPGTTRIARASIDVAYRSNLYLSHCTAFGLRTSTSLRATEDRCTLPVPDAVTLDSHGETSYRNIALFDPSGSPTANEAFARIYIPNCLLLPAALCTKWLASMDPLNFGPYLQVRKVSMTLVDSDLPVVITSGNLPPLDGKYVDGSQTYDLTTDANDGGAGIAKIQLDHTSLVPSSQQETLARTPDTCDPSHQTASLGSRICPQSDRLVSPVDTSTFPEGKNLLRAWSVDPAGNTSEKKFSLLVDRTAPEAPQGLYFLTPAKGSAQVYWDEATDSELPDGNNGSGTAHYRFRSKIDGGAWGAWSEVSRSRQLSSEVTDQPAGTTVTFEVVSVDSVGNVSVPATMTGLVHDPNEDTPPGGSGTPDDPAPDVSAPVSDEGSESAGGLPTNVPTGAVPISLHITNGQNPPAITPPIWNSSYPWQQASGYGDWTPKVQSNLASGYELKRGHAGRPGLWIWPTGSQANGYKLYQPGYAEFAFTAPGTTRIARASMDLAYRSLLYTSHCTEIGLRTSSEIRAKNTNCLPPVPDRIVIDSHGATSYRNVPLFDPSSNPTTKEAYARIFIPSCQLLYIEFCSQLIPTMDPLNFGPYLQVQRVDMTLVDDDRPVVKTSAAFSDLNGKYVDGKQAYDLATTEADAGAGIASTQVDHTSPPPASQQDMLLAKPAACDAGHYAPELGSRICPASDSLTIPVDTTTFPEGRNRVRVWAADPAGNVGEKKLSVLVDRTAPPAPRARPLKPDEGSGQIYWDEAIDPALPDGTHGSGTVNYRFRSKVNDGSWTDWKEVPRSQQLSDEVFDKPIGTVVSFEITAVDGVGNVSAASGVSVAVRGKAPTSLIGGELGALDGKYTQGLSPVITSISATDDEAGVDSVALGSPSAPFNATVATPCSPGQQRYSAGKRQCPKVFAPDISVPLNTFSEGTHMFQVSASDRAFNQGSGAVTLSVDRTAPDVPEFLDVVSDDSSADLSWDDSEDPLLNDGTPGSGVARYEWRMKNEQDWNGWQVVDLSETPQIDNLQIGSTIEFEVRSVDSVGNTSLASTISGIVGAEDEGLGDPSGDDGALSMNTPVTPPDTPQVVQVKGRKYKDGCQTGVRLQIPSSTPAEGPNAVDAQGLSLDSNTCVGSYLISTPPGAWDAAMNVSASASVNAKSVAFQSLATSNNGHSAGYMHGWWEDPNPLALTVNEIFAVDDWEWDGTCVRGDRNSHTTYNYFEASFSHWTVSRYRDKVRKYCKKIRTTGNGSFYNDDFCKAQPRTHTKIHVHVDGFRRGGIDGRASGKAWGGCNSLLDFNQKLKRTIYEP